MPLVQRSRVTKVSRTGKLEPKIELSNVLFPELCVPKIAILALAVGNEVSSGLYTMLVT